MKNQPKIRTCIACRNTDTKAGLLRIVKTPHGEIMLDKTLKANGRGAYICNNIECINKAKKSRALNRAFKCEIDNQIYQQILEQIIEGK